MDQAYEVLIVAGKKCFVYDAAIGNLLAEYTPTSGHSAAKLITPKTLSVVADHYMMGATDKHLKTWRIGGTEAKKMTVSLVAGPVSVVTTTSCGTYCVAGIQNCIYIWEVMSGNLLLKTSFGDSNITCLKFTGDNSMLLSGYKDGRVVACFLSKLVDVTSDKKRIEIYYKLTQHTVEVTDICTGCLGAISRVATTSLDMTCQLYELNTGLLLCTIYFDTPLTAVVMDPFEDYLFFGDTTGNIYKVNTSERLPKEIHYIEKESTKIHGHGSKIFAMSFSLEGNKFMSASANLCKVWSVETMACLLTFPFESTITNAFLSMKPTALSELDIKPVFSFPIFQRNEESGLQAEDQCRFRTVKLAQQNLSLMHHRSLDGLYSKRILNWQVEETPRKVSPVSVSENMFMETVRGESATDMRTINNQMYSALIHQGLEALSDSAFSAVRN